MRPGWFAHRSSRVLLAMALVLGAALSLAVTDHGSRAQADPSGWQYGPNSGSQCNNPDAPPNCQGQWQYPPIAYPASDVPQIQQVTKGQCMPYDATHIVCKRGYTPPLARGTLLQRSWSDWLGEFKYAFMQKQLALLSSDPRYTKKSFAYGGKTYSLKEWWQRTNPWVSLGLEVYQNRINVISARVPNTSDTTYATFVVQSVLPGMDIPEFPKSGTKVAQLNWAASISPPGKPQLVVSQ
jgi:hypothetical protein